MTKYSEKYERGYDRAALRSAFVSLFWVIITERKKRGGFTFQALAKAIGSTKHELSRWFSGATPNWTLNTVANLAHALDVELVVHARQRGSSVVYTPAGVQVSGMNEQYTETHREGSTSAEPVRGFEVSPSQKVDWSRFSKPQTSAKAA